MAKGKGGKPSASAGPKLRKMHGPKKKMWHCWDSTTRLHFGQAGLLTKYYNKESFEQALSAKGIRNNIDGLWAEFIRVPDSEKKAWFKNLKK